MPESRRSSSPPPQWEVFKEPTDSSDIGDDTEASHRERSSIKGPLGKRKETKWFESSMSLKRAKHNMVKAGDASALGLSRLTLSTDPVGPSRSSNAMTTTKSSISVSSASSNHADGSSKGHSQNVSRTSTDTRNTLKPEVFKRSGVQASSSSRFGTGLASSSKPPRLARKSTGGEVPRVSIQPKRIINEVIEISSDSDEDPPPRLLASSSKKPPSQKAVTLSGSTTTEVGSSKIKQVKRPTAIKSSGGKVPRPSSLGFHVGEDENDEASPPLRQHEHIPSLSSSAIAFNTLDLDTEVGQITHPKLQLNPKLRKPSTPERMIVKQQAISPEIPKASASKAKKKSGDGIQSLVDAFMSAAKSNDELHHRRSESRITIKGDTLENAIDLTSDTDEHRHAPPSRPSKISDIVESSGGMGKKPNSTPPSFKMLTVKGKEEAFATRPSKLANEVFSKSFLPPSSSSPPLVSPSDLPPSSANTSDMDMEDVRPIPGSSNNRRQSASSAQIHPQRDHRAIDSTTLASVATTSSPRKTEFLKPTFRSASTGTVSVSSEYPITTVTPSGDEYLPSSDPSSPGIISPPATSSLPFPNVQEGSSSSSDSLHTAKRTQLIPAVLPSHHVSPRIITARTSSPSSNVEMAPDDNGATSRRQKIHTNPNQSEEEAMQVVEEVMADMSDDDMDSDNMNGMHNTEKSTDHSPQTSSDEAGPSHAPPSSSSFSAENDRYISRRSSRSSNGENWPFEQEPINTPSSPASRNTTPEDLTVTQVGQTISEQKTYGGFAAITWKEYSRNLSNFKLKYRHNSDLQPSLVDHVVEMTKRADFLHTATDMRTLFEAMILENTIEDEPEAPKIELLNDVDDSASPPWEFYYTNEMLYGEGVPPPDINDLVGCSCKGGCSSKSKSCRCLQRQTQVIGPDHKDFAYDKNGKLKRPGYPIFECNILCGCGEECRNRVIQKGRKVSVHLRKTMNKGWGVFAGKRIQQGTFVGIYSGELITSEEAQQRGVAYNKFGRTYLFDLDFHHLKPPGDEDTWQAEFTVDAFKAGNFTRFLNHSCDPNTRLYPCYINEGNLRKPLLAVFARRDIDANEEVCFSYTGDYPDESERPAKGQLEAMSLAAQAKATVVEISTEKDKIYEVCRCGSWNCTGYMFKYDPELSGDEDDGDDEGN